MTTRIDEIADRIFRISTFVPEVAPPAGFAFNQFLIAAEEPLLFHTGHRMLFPTVLDAVAQVISPDRLRWISFGHLEADECGAMNLWLAAAPDSEVAHGATACDVSLNDLADRPPRLLTDGETIDLGGRRVRYIDTPHTPHGWDAGLLFEEVTGTLLCGDLFTQTGLTEALTEGDIVGPAVAAEELFGFSSLHPQMGATIRRLALLAPKTLGLMHGPSFTGDTRAALEALADYYDGRASVWREQPALAA
ncbi:MAG TPA: MBL fold metallo-hydrolase [Allosphingosinicella sp.]|nr:MBL fold metallo-hydrolase [Allosphingosinicella sp.]